MKKSIVDYLEQTSKIYNEKTIFEEKDSKISYFDFCNDSKIIATNILAFNLIRGTKHYDFFTQLIDAEKGMSYYCID